MCDRQSCTIISDPRAARLALTETAESRYLLQLKGKRARIDGWHEQAKDFYFGLRDKPELHALVATTGVTGERIVQGIQLLQAVEATRLQQSAQKGSVGDVRDQRNAAFLKLKLWMQSFRKVARVALFSAPAYLATLGLEPAPRKRKPEEEEGEKKQETKKPKKTKSKKAGATPSDPNGKQCPGNADQQRACKLLIR